LRKQKVQGQRSGSFLKERTKKLFTLFGSYLYPAASSKNKSFLFLCFKKELLPFLTDTSVSGANNALRIRFRSQIMRGQCALSAAMTATAGTLADTPRDSEAEAREATRLLRAVIEAVPSLIYVKDRQGRMLICNPPALALIGKPWSEVAGRTDAELLDDPAQGAAIMQTDRRLMDSGGTEQLEETVGHDAFGPRTFLSTKTAFRGEDGAVIGLVGTSVEITARKRDQQALAASEARFRSVLDNLFAFVGICDLDGRLLEANRAPVEGAGIPFADIIGRPVWDTYWFGYDNAVRDRMRDSVARARGGETVRFDIPIRWRDDTRIIIDFQIAPLRNNAGEIVQLVPSGVDVTARTEAQAGLQEALDQFRAMGDAVPYGAWLADPDGRVRYASPSYLDLLGLSLDEVRQSGWVHRLPAEERDAVRASWRDAVATGQKLENIYTVRNRHGALMHVLSRGRPIRDSAGRITSWAGISLDITAFRRSEEQRQLLIRELNHRVKNLFAVLSGMIAMSARTARDPRELADALRGRLMALSRAHELIQPALAAELTDRSASLRDLISLVLEPHLLPGAERLHVEGPDIHIAASVATALALTLHELATNAVKYGALSTPDGRLDITWSREDAHLVLTWAEAGGPLVAGPPARSGFGSQLARITVSRQLGGAITFNWHPTGLHIVLTADLRHLKDAGAS